LPDTEPFLDDTFLGELGETLTLLGEDEEAFEEFLSGHPELRGTRRGRASFDRARLRDG